MKANRAIRIEAQWRQSLWGSILCSGEMWPPTNASDSNCGNTLASNSGINIARFRPSRTRESCGLLLGGQATCHFHLLVHMYAEACLAIRDSNSTACCWRGVYAMQCRSLPKQFSTVLRCRDKPKTTLMKTTLAVSTCQPKFSPSLPDDLNNASKTLVEQPPQF